MQILVQIVQNWFSSAFTLGSSGRGIAWIGGHLDLVIHLVPIQKIGQVDPPQYEFHNRRDLSLDGCPAVTTYPMTQEENLSITTIRCDLAIVTHGEKIHNFGCQTKVLVVVFGQLPTKTLRLTIIMTYLCIFLAWVTMGQLQWMVVMDEFFFLVWGLVGGIASFHMALAGTYLPYKLASNTWEERWRFEEWVNGLLHMKMHCVEMNDVIHFLGDITFFFFPDGWMGWKGPWDLSLTFIWQGWFFIGGLVGFMGHFLSW